MTAKKFSPRKDGILKGRTLELFHHGTVEEWGAKQPQTDSFAIIHPKNKKRKHGLYVVLHSAGHDLYSCLGCTVYKGNHDIYHTPDDLYGLYLDCREHAATDFWWGGINAKDEGDPERKNAMQAVEKRVYATIEWTIKKYNIDPQRVYLCGNSMGGSGSLGIGMCRGDLFAAVKVNVPAGVEHMIDRCFNSGLNIPDPPVCIDYSAQNDAWSKGHDKFYRVMREQKFALYGYWADFGHANNDPLMLLKNDLIHSFDWLSVRKDQAYPVFTQADCDTPNPWENDPEKVPIAGQVNAFFRWKNGKDLQNSFTMNLYIISPEKLQTFFPIPEKAKVNVSFRRLQQFKIAPHEKIAYSFGDKTGIVEADENGLLTLEQLELTQTPQTIFLKRTVQA